MAQLLALLPSLLGAVSEGSAGGGGILGTLGRIGGATLKALGGGLETEFVRDRKIQQEHRNNYQPIRTMGGKRYQEKPRYQQNVGGGYDNYNDAENGDDDEEEIIDIKRPSKKHKIVKKGIQQTHIGKKMAHVINNRGRY